jgi:hypothetical protein
LQENAASQAGAPPFNLVRHPAEPTVPPPMIRTMESDREALQSGSKPSLEAKHLTPARTFQTASVPYMPIAIKPDAVPAPPIPVPPVPAQEVSTSPIEKQYGTDPYREPLV